ncbi:kinase-like domain-containing protein [Glomus cerebriforme]|uniref:Kinase-like domain-containing protein n=1 Tax=Glomus cerebriforme TaxID=658196 RepID=A0A397SMM1_9GLOM|nr:kinase-like domain-containing protein [Glomus cerebriforme]
MKCFGITQDPKTLNYALVLEFMKSDLRTYLNQNFNSITWEQKLIIICHICYGLHIIHENKLIHKDLHPGNILNDNIRTLISDFGFSIPANEILSNSNEKNIYGVMPYIAPEILREKSHTQASDVYSLGIIINEIITMTTPFNNEPHDYVLALDICHGKRPKIREETPKFLKELIQKCWDAIPENRPASKEIYDILTFNIKKVKNLEELSYNFNESTNVTTKSSLTMETHPQAIYTSRILNLPAHLPEPINCPNQEEFISSRIIVQKKEQLNIPRSECLECAITDFNKLT